MVGPKWLPIMLLRAFRFNLVFGLVSVMMMEEFFIQLRVLGPYRWYIFL